MLPTIRPCTLTDLPTLQTISRETFTATFGAQNDPADLATYLETAYNSTQLTTELTDPNSHFYFVQLDDQIVGYLKLNTGAAQTEAMGDSALEVERIYVRASYQHRGLGKHLLQLAEQLAQDAHKTTLWLGVWEHNVNAQGFYHRFGFQQFSEHAFNLGTDRQIDLLYRKNLA